MPMPENATSFTDVNVTGAFYADGTAVNPSATTAVTPGTVSASKAVVVGADKNIDTIAIAEGGLKIGAGAGTAVTGTAAELNALTDASAEIATVVAAVATPAAYSEVAADIAAALVAAGLMEAEA